jgi:hypothetical protein
LNDGVCAANVIEATTTTTTTTMATTTTAAFEQTENEFVFQSKFEEFVSRMQDFCRIEIKKTAADLKMQNEVCLTKDDLTINSVDLKKDLDMKLEEQNEKLSGLNQTVIEMKSKFDAALEASNCQVENIFYHQEIIALKDENAALKARNAALEKKHIKQQIELENKYKSDIEKKFKDELKKQYDNIMREVKSLS